MYYFTLFFLVLIALICHRLVHSLLGRTFIAISHDENLAESLGINTMQKKLISFTISAIFSGVAGALYASYNSVISPDIAYFARGMDVLACLIVGGAGTMAGPIIGTFVMTAIPEALQIVPTLRTLINGIILLIFIIFLPDRYRGRIQSPLFAMGPFIEDQGWGAMALLEVSGLTKAFGGLTAVSGLNFSVEQGQLVSIIGPNGAGKTTLFNLLTGIYRPTAGKIVFDGNDITGCKPYQSAAPRHRADVPEDHCFPKRDGARQRDHRPIRFI